MSDPIGELKELFIDNEWVPPVNKKYMDVLNPASEEVIQQVAVASAVDVGLAVQAAKRAFATWGTTSGTERAVYLRRMGELVAKRMDALSRLETLDNGKPLAEAVGDMEDVSSCFNYYANAAEALDARQYEKVALPLKDFQGALRYEPVGVVAAVIPWNYPALMALWKLAPALAAGCSAQALGSHSIECATIGPDSSRRWITRRRFERGERLGRGSWMSPGLSSRRTQSGLYRKRTYRTHHHDRGGKRDQEDHSGARRQVARDRIRQSQLGTHSRVGHVRLFREQRSNLQCDVATTRAQGHCR